MIGEGVWVLSPGAEARRRRPRVRVVVAVRGAPDNPAGSRDPAPVSLPFSRTAPRDASPVPSPNYLARPPSDPSPLYSTCPWAMA